MNKYSLQYKQGQHRPNEQLIVRPDGVEIAKSYNGVLGEKAVVGLLNSETTKLRNRLDVIENYIRALQDRHEGDASLHYMGVVHACELILDEFFEERRLAPITYISVGKNVQNIARLPLLRKLAALRGITESETLYTLTAHRDRFFPSAVYRIMLNDGNEPQLVINAKAVADWLSLKHMVNYLQKELEAGTVNL